MQDKLMLKSMAAGFALALCSMAAPACDRANMAVGVLEARQHFVEIFTGANGPLYSVKTKQGELLAEHMAEDELIGRFPELESMIKGVADDASLGPRKAKKFDQL